MQLDLSKYRLGWDTSTATCLEVESQTKETIDTIDAPANDDSGDDGHTDETDDTHDHISQNKSQALVYYWEVQYPAFFSNRSLSSCLGLFFSSDGTIIHCYTVQIFMKASQDSCL